MHFSNIPQYPKARWETDVSIRDLLGHVERWTKEYGLTLDPDYQREHVWTEDQQVAYVEHILRGGEVGQNIILNAPNFTAGTSTIAEVVDGKQRLTAMLRFVRNEIRVLAQEGHPEGLLYQEFKGRPSMWWGFKWRIVELDRLGILNLYLSLNGGGTQHTKDELARVEILRDLELERLAAV